jgi:hypothetical protein
MRASTDARVTAIIAHELGHLRSFSDPGTNQSDLNEGEAEANRYAELWGYPCVDNIYKTEECDELQKIARYGGMNWRIFYAKTSLRGEYFTCLCPGERFSVDQFPYEYGDDFEDTRSYITDRSKQPVKSARSTGS